MHIPTMTRGDTEPDLVITISDARADANFSSLTPSDVRVLIERGGEVVLDDAVDEVTPAGDGKSAVVRRAWGVNDTQESGRHWVYIRVMPWDQTFPDEGPLRLDIARAAGDA